MLLVFVLLGSAVMIDKQETYRPRERVISATAISDYKEVAQYRPAAGCSRVFADKAATIVNCFIRRMIRANKTN